MKSFLTASVLAVVQGLASAASFDCAKAQAEIEKIICSDADLSSLDDALAEAYKAALTDQKRSEVIRSEQKRWLRARNRCVEVACVRQSYQAQLQILSAKGDATPQIVDKSAKLLEETEASKAVRMQVALGKFAYKLTHTRASSFCSGLFKAMQTNSSEIAYIEPVLRTDNPDHPGLAKYEACYRDERPRGESSFGLCGVGTRRFRLYRLDMDGQPGNGREEYLYGQEPDCHQQAPAAQYAQVNLETCQHQQITPVAPESPGGWNGYADGSINALILFRGEYLVIDAQNFEEAGVGITAWIYNKQKRWFESPFQCVWHSLQQR